MTKPYTIRYLSTAEKDLVDIFEYIKKDNVSAAKSQLERFDKLISKLAKNPFLGIVPKDKRLKKIGYRMLIIDKYLIFYVIKTNIVQIRCVIHGARRYNFLVP